MQSFDLTPSERQEMYKFTIQLLEGYYSDTKSNRVSPRLDISEIVKEVRKVDFSATLTSKEALKHLVEGYEKTIRHQTEIGEKLKGLLKNSGWTVMNSSPFPVLCFMDENYLDNPDFTKTVIKNIIDSGKSWLSIYPIFGKPTFRACITNYNTSEEDIEALVGELNEGREVLESKIKNQETR